MLNSVALFTDIVENKRYFLHEHPWMARSWELQCVKDIEKLNGVERVRLDMCQYGMESHIQSKDGPRGPVLKPTGMLTNSWCLRIELSKRCQGGRKHVHLVGGYLSRTCGTKEGGFVSEIVHSSYVLN